MDLFQTNPLANFLPYDGIAINYGSVLDKVRSQYYFDTLLQEIPWVNDEVYLFGKRIVTQRKVAWFGADKYNYTYSNATKKAHLWTPVLLELKEHVEKITNITYNSCLLNLYHDGSEGVSWHSDAELALGKTPAIASLSLGAARKFNFKHKSTHKKIEIVLENGDLLIMKDSIQTHWLHALPKSKLITKPRINLTFRTIHAVI